MGVRPFREAIAVLLGRPRVVTYAGRSTVHTEPEAWRCARCGQGMVAAPSSSLYSHLCQGYVAPARRAIRYMGLRAHVRSVWATVWRNRPRLVSAKPPHGERTGAKVYKAPVPDADFPDPGRAENERYGYVADPDRDLPGPLDWLERMSRKEPGR